MQYVFISLFVALVVTLNKVLGDTVYITVPNNFDSVAIILTVIGLIFVSVMGIAACVYSKGGKV